MTVIITYIDVKECMIHDVAVMRWQM